MKLHDCFPFDQRLKRIVIKNRPNWSQLRRERSFRSAVSVQPTVRDFAVQRLNGSLAASSIFEPELVLYQAHGKLLDAATSAGRASQTALGYISVEALQFRPRRACVCYLYLAGHAPSGVQLSIGCRCGGNQQSKL